MTSTSVASPVAYAYISPKIDVSAFDHEIAIERVAAEKPESGILIIVDCCAHRDELITYIVSRRADTACVERPAIQCPAWLCRQRQAKRRGGKNQLA